MRTRYCNVALPVPLRTTFTYEIPGSDPAGLQTGSRVLVPFRRKSLVGAVVELLDTRPANIQPEIKIREIIKLLDQGSPALTPQLIELAQWIAAYYLAPIGEVLRGMLPPVTDVRMTRELALTDAGRGAAAEWHRLQSVRDLQANADANAKHPLPEETETQFLQALSTKEHALPWTAALKTGITAVQLQKLQRRGLIEIRERVSSSARRTQQVIAWREAASGYPSDSQEKAPSHDQVPGRSKPRGSKAIAENRLRRIRALLLAERGPLPLAQLLRLAEVSRSLIERLLREGILESWEETIDPAEDPFDAGYEPPAHELNPHQEAALKAIRERATRGAFAAQLLFGVTGSGKTEVYLRAVQETLARGQTAIILVPEIALTLWLGRQCRAWFGAHFEGVAVLHSALSDVARAREWWRVRNGEARVVVGTRSAIFAPLSNLGLIIVDEEQENSYKQEETPRYHGRDVAIVRAKMENAIALLGSATPSLESFHNAENGKYQLLTLASRVADRSMASVEVIDLREEFQRTKQTSPISAALHVGIQECLAAQTQALILINRRGYSWSVLCRSCGASVQCANCSISMTYHKHRNRLECHYCGSLQSVPLACPKCQSRYVYYFGEGSEHLEERLRQEFPGARIARLDRDTAHTKKQFQDTLGAFAGGALDILVGTQMLAKGHDFHRVTLVGVVSADSALTMPDFRAAERTFQLLTQVAGRAGRGDLKGRVLIQTYYPDHYAIQDAVKQDYRSFYDREMTFRKMMAYPPFTALANIIVRDVRLEKAIKWSQQLSGFLTPHNGKDLRVLGPAAAPLARLKKEHRFQFLLKSPKRSVMTRLLSRAMNFCDAQEIPQTAVLVDVDPLSLM
jgi:primosomal protein N' (replication factor Y) (superfamily II helicase)